MNDPEGFLSRWSRKKRAGEKHEFEPVGDRSARPGESGDPVLDSSPGLTRGSRGNELDQSEPPQTVAESEKKSEQDAEYDLSQLPSLEDITAETDIRPFLARGVPASLRQDALRRMWVADPNIRDFIGIAENQWDFTVTGGAPGFDLSPPTGDIARMIADIFGQKQEDETPKAIEQADASDAQVARDTSSGVEPASDQFGVNAVHGNANENPEQTPSVRRTQFVKAEVPPIASQQDAASQEEAPRVRRSHGGAVPK